MKPIIDPPSRGRRDVSYVCWFCAHQGTHHPHECDGADDRCQCGCWSELVAFTVRVNRRELAACQAVVDAARAYVAFDEDDDEAFDALFDALATLASLNAGDA